MHISGRPGARHRIPVPMTATLDTAPRGPAAHLPTRRRTSLNITAAQAQLGYTPVVGMAEALERTIHHYRSRGY